MPETMYARRKQYGRRSLVVLVPADLHAALTERAAENEEPMAALVRRALRAYLRPPETAPAPARSRASRRMF